MSSTPNNQANQQYANPTPVSSSTRQRSKQARLKPPEPMEAQPISPQTNGVELRYYTSIVAHEQKKQYKVQKPAQEGDEPSANLPAGQQKSASAKKKKHYGLTPIHQRKAQNMPENLQNFDEEDLRDEFTVPNDYKLWKVLMNAYIVDSRKMKKEKRRKSKAIEERLLERQNEDARHNLNEGPQIVSKSSAFKQPNFIPPFRFKMIPQNLTNIPSILPPPEIFKFSQKRSPPSLLLEDKPTKRPLFSEATDRLEKRKEKFGFDVPVSAYVSKREDQPLFSSLLIPKPKQEEEKNIGNPQNKDSRSPVEGGECGKSQKNSQK